MTEQKFNPAFGVGYAVNFIIAVANSEFMTSLREKIAILEPDSVEDHVLSMADNESNGPVQVAVRGNDSIILIPATESGTIQGVIADCNTPTGPDDTLQHDRKLFAFAHNICQTRFLGSQFALVRFHGLNILTVAKSVACQLNDAPDVLMSNDDVVMYALTDDAELTLADSITSDDATMQALANKLRHRRSRQTVQRRPRRQAS